MMYDVYPNHPCVSLLLVPVTVVAVRLAVQTSPARIKARARDLSSRVFGRRKNWTLPFHLAFNLRPPGGVNCTLAAT